MVKDGWIDPRCTPLELPNGMRGPFIELGDGSLMTMVDNDPTYRAPLKGVLTSRDGGETWSDPRQVYAGPGPGIPASGLLTRTRQGIIVMVYVDYSTVKIGWDDEAGEPVENIRADVWSIRSLDEGETWVDRQKIFDGYCGALINIIETRSGRIVVPIPVLLRGPGRHEVRTYVSADQGQTWRGSNIIDLGGRGHHGGADEGTVVELENGRLLMLLRTNWDQFWEAFSDDDGLSWRTVRPSGIDASSAPGQLQRLSSGRLLLLWNRLYPDWSNTFSRSGQAASETMASRHRQELSIAFSEDEGQTWSESQVLTRDLARPSYPRLFERSPGELWITTAFGGILQVRIREEDFVG